MIKSRVRTSGIIPLTKREVFVNDVYVGKADSKQLCWLSGGSLRYAYMNNGLWVLYKGYEVVCDGPGVRYIEDVK